MSKGFTIIIILRLATGGLKLITSSENARAAEGPATIPGLYPAGRIPKTHAAL